MRSFVCLRSWRQLRRTIRTSVAVDGGLEALFLDCSIQVHPSTCLNVVVIAFTVAKLEVSVSPMSVWGFPDPFDSSGVE